MGTCIAVAILSVCLCLIALLSIIFFFISVCVYVNKSCRCGSMLDSKKMSNMPDQFGPGPVTKVLRELTQSCINNAIQDTKVYHLIPKGEGRVIVSGMYRTLLSVVLIVRCSFQLQNDSV